MDYVNVFAVITQFNQMLDEMSKKQDNMKETLAKLQKIMELVVSKVDDWSDRFGEITELNKLRGRLDAMELASDDEKVPSSNPST